MLVGDCTINTSPVRLVEVALVTETCRVQDWPMVDDAGSEPIGVLTFVNEPTLHDDFRSTPNCQQL